MRYNILNGKPSESLSIDAPYDTLHDAEFDVATGISHNCDKCTDVPCNVDKANAILMLNKLNQWSSHD
jgi:hypothetical protein